MTHSVYIGLVANRCFKTARNGKLSFQSLPPNDPNPDPNLTLSDYEKDFTAVQSGDLFLESAAPVGALAARGDDQGSLRVTVDMEFSVPEVKVVESKREGRCKGHY